MAQQDVGLELQPQVRPVVDPLPLADLLADAHLARRR